MVWPYLCLPVCLLRKGVCTARGNTAGFLQASLAMLQPGPGSWFLSLGSCPPATDLPPMIVNKLACGPNESLRDFFHFLPGRNESLKSNALQRGSWLPPVQDCCQHRPNHLTYAVSKARQARVAKKWSVHSPPCSSGGQPALQREPPFNYGSAAASHAGKAEVS